MRKLFLFYLVISCFCLRAEEGDGFEKIRRLLSEFKELSEREYRRKVGDMIKKMDRSFSYQERVCKGDFSPLVFQSQQSQGEQGEQGEEGEAVVDQKACLSELMELKRSYVDILFQKGPNLFRPLTRRGWRGWRSSENRPSRPYRPLLKFDRVA